MKNQEIAKIFYQLAVYLEMEGVDFKPYAFERAAFNLENLSEDVENIYKQGGIKALEKIPGVGKSLAEKIREYLKTGKIKEYETFKKKMPVDIDELSAVEGIGPKMIGDLYKQLKIKNLNDLEKAAKAGKIRNLPNFGEKTEKNILQGIEFLKRTKGRFLLGEILPVVNEIIANLKSLKGVRKISPAGSVRRMKETVGDVDILITSSNPKKVISYFVSLPDIIKIWGEGPTKASIRLEVGFDVDLRVLPDKEFGSALQYFTGSKEHNIALRKIAIEKGMKLNEYGLFKGKKSIASKTEEEIYKALELPYFEPELRENTGELEAALKGKLPKVISYKNIKGDLHVHSNWDGGADSIEEISRAAQEIGYEYIGISDHTKFLHIEHGLDEKQLLRQRKEINDLNSVTRILNSNFRILHGCEANIMADGSIDIDDEVLAQLDYVIAGVHSQMKMSKRGMTERIIKAMKNPNVDIISHPTGRLIQKREEYEIDFDEILKIAKETGTILEINSFPGRLDLKDINIKKAVEAGVKMIINTDAHNLDQLRFMELGISQARRGWAEKKDIINAWPLEKLLKFFKKK
ncbi:MAG: DNA polymerase/3'-5' exonuclease PolX [bacterium]|nr:DNA polymerase/3'-5' exonuclease PolX [bacterium]